MISFLLVFHAFMLFAEAANELDVVTIRRIHSGRHCIQLCSVQFTQTRTISPKGIPSPTPAVSSAAPSVSDVEQGPSADVSMPIFNPEGPHHLFVPGALSKDGRYQLMYNNFIFDLLPLGTLGQMCAVVRGCHVGIFPVLYIIFLPSAP